MAISREKKEQIVDDLKDQLKATEAIVFTDFRGLSVPQQQTLRRNLRDAEADFQVVKNTLTKIALKELGRPIPEDYLMGPTALTLLPDDIARAAKAILDFAKETDALVIKGGMVGTQIIGAEDVQELADLPAREVLFAQLLGVIQGSAGSVIRMLEAPASELVRTLQAPMQELTLTIQAYSEQKS